MVKPITSGLLYDYAECPHRVYLDSFASETEQDPENSFVKLLWTRAVTHRRETLGSLADTSVDLRQYDDRPRERFTRLAMSRKEPLIIGARLLGADLIAEPDVMRYEHGCYVPGMIKINRAKVDDCEVLDIEKPYKLSYALQLAIAVDLLERDGILTVRKGFIWDVNRNEIPYWLDTAADGFGDESWWDRYQDALYHLRRIIYKKEKTEPAWHSACKLCHWHSHCLEALTEADDLTLIPELGPSRRTALKSHFETITQLGSADINPFDKKRIKGVGPKMLHRLHERAELQKAEDRRPYLREPVVLPRLPEVGAEIYFDIEADPFRDLCYLHGFTVRTTAGETYTAIFADRPEDEAEKFAEAVRFLISQDGPIYHYSSYERVFYKKLAKRYPNACSSEQLATLLARMVDLYPKASEAVWPTRDHSIKTLARYLGFEWRDSDPSGTSSVDWFDQWIRTGDPQIRERIILYNEDDCVAMRVLADGLVGMRVRRNFQ